MELKLVSASVNESEVIVSHYGNELRFNAKVFDKTSTTEDYNIFGEINAFWATQSHEFQDQTFRLYTQMADAFNTADEDTETLSRALMRLVDAFYQLHSEKVLHDIYRWVAIKSDLIVPSDIRDEFKSSPDAEVIGTRERTYLRDDYLWLVAMTIALRPMVPIWGEFVSRTKHEVSPIWKEYYSLNLLANTHIRESAPMERLHVFICHTMQSDQNLAPAVLGGISTEDYPNWILAMTVVRRLSVADIRGYPNTHTVVANIYRYIDSKVRDNDSSWKRGTKEKFSPTATGNEENNISRLEDYKTKQELPAGDIAIIEAQAMDIYGTVMRLEPTINPQLIQDSIESVQALRGERIWDPQRTLVQWTLAKVIPARGISYMSHDILLGCVAATQAILWHRGYHDLAALVSARALRSGGDFAPNEARAPISKELKDQLDLLWPHARKGAKKLDKLKNPAIVAITSVEQKLGQYDWIRTIPSHWQSSTLVKSRDRRLIVPIGIRVMLAELAVDLAKRKIEAPQGLQVNQ